MILIFHFFSFFFTAWLSHILKRINRTVYFKRGGLGGDVRAMCMRVHYGECTCNCYGKTIRLWISTCLSISLWRASSYTRVLWLKESVTPKSVSFSNFEGDLLQGITTLGQNLPHCILILCFVLHIYVQARHIKNDFLLHGATMASWINNW